MRTILLVVVSVFAFLIGGCSESISGGVKSYGPEYMTYSCSASAFNEACRAVIYELSYKKKVDENTMAHPHYAEGVSSHRKNDGTAIATKFYFKTKDDEGFEYSITTIILLGKEPMVVLETTNPLQAKLVNALMKEFNKRGIKAKTP